MIKKYVYFLFFLSFFICSIKSAESVLIVDEVPLGNTGIPKSPDATGDVRLITVYLPALAMTNPTQRFPVIYYLPGLGGTNETFTIGNQVILDDLIANDQMIPTIVVHVDPSVTDEVDTDGKRRYLGTWYVNSKLNGKFEDWVTDILIPFVDENYPTITQKGFRAVMGQSMGGYGSLFLGMRHPDLFAGFASASGTPFWVIATKAKLVAPEQPDPGQEMFTLNSLIIPEIPTEGPNEGQVTPDNGGLSFSVFSYAAAFSPNVNNPPYFVDLPFKVDDQNRPKFKTGDFFIANPSNGNIIQTTVSLIPRKKVIDRWKEKDPYFLVSDARKTAQEQSIYLDGGDAELINAAGARVLSDKMAKLAIDHEYILYRGGHTTCLVTEICSRHRTMFQLLSAQFAQAAIFADDVRVKIVGEGKLKLTDNALCTIPNGAIVGIETSPELDIKKTAVNVTLKKKARLKIGDDTQEGGVLQIGNRFTKARLKGKPSLNDHIIKTKIALKSKKALLEVGRLGVLGLAVGIDGKNTRTLNHAAATSLTNVKKGEVIVKKGKLRARQTAAGNTSDSSLILFGPSEEPLRIEAENRGVIEGGSNTITMLDNLKRHTVVLNPTGVDMPGGIRNNLNTDPHAIDFFFKAPIGSTIFYTNINTLDTLPSTNV